MAAEICLLTIRSIFSNISLLIDRSIKYKIIPRSSILREGDPFRKRLPKEPAQKEAPRPNRPQPSGPFSPAHKQTYTKAASHRNNRSRSGPFKTDHPQTKFPAPAT